MKEIPSIKMYAFTIDCKDASALAAFYAKLLQWQVMFSNEEYTCLGAPTAAHGGYPSLTFQQNPQYQPPVWPEEPQAQQQMAHLDFAVADLEASVAYALECGATLSEKQYSQDWRVLFDPAGHPFCLCRMKELMDSPDFALL